MKDPGEPAFAGPVPGNGADPEHLARACWALALFTEVFRAGPAATARKLTELGISSARYAYLAPWDLARLLDDLAGHQVPAWTENLVRRLTSKHEAYRDRPWSADDAPRAFIERQLRAIVGISLEITRIEAKAKLSQNRPAADVEGVITGLRERGDKEVADAVERARN